MCIHLSTLLYVFDGFDSTSSINSEEYYSINEIENEGTQQKQQRASLSL